MSIVVFGLTKTLEKGDKTRWAELLSELKDSGHIIVVATGKELKNKERNKIENTYGEMDAIYTLVEKDQRSSYERIATDMGATAKDMVLVGTNTKHGYVIENHCKGQFVEFKEQPEQLDEMMLHNAQKRIHASHDELRTKLVKLQLCK